MNIKKHNHPIVIGSDLKELLLLTGITDEEIIEHYKPKRGVKLSIGALKRYKGVTQKDVDSGKCYTYGVPVNFMNWLTDYIKEGRNEK